MKTSNELKSLLVLASVLMASVSQAYTPTDSQQRACESLLLPQVRQTILAHQKSIAIGADLTSKEVDSIHCVLKPDNYESMSQIPMNADDQVTFYDAAKFMNPLNPSYYAAVQCGTDCDSVNSDGSNANSCQYRFTFRVHFGARNKVDYGSEGKRGEGCFLYPESSTPTFEIRVN